MSHENTTRGQLYFLWHSDTSVTFSGYGLATEAGRKDLLVGLLMVDRPQPVSRAWLARVKQCFGGYELHPMTASQERGMLCHIRIAPESLALVTTLDDPLSERLRIALTPLLTRSPQPRLQLHWNGAERVWLSQLDGERPALRNGHLRAHAHAHSNGLTPSPAGQPIFSLGQVVATPGAIDALVEANCGAMEFLSRHIRGDWGDLCEEDRQANQYAVGHGLRILSAYHLPTGTKFWVITEHDRSVTTLLLPFEY